MLGRLVKNNPHRLVQKVTVVGKTDGIFQKVLEVVKGFEKVIYHCRPAGEVVVQQSKRNMDDVDIITAEAPLFTKVRDTETAKSSIVVPRTLDPDGVIKERMANSKDLRFTEDNEVGYGEFFLSDGQ